MEKIIKVSVIVPVYNVEKYLKRCLDNLINQTLSDIEIICVNDGSTDNSLEILENYSKQDERIKIINQQNGGLSVARNTGMEVAVGEYIGFVDSDDWVDVDFYEKLYNAAKNNDCDIAVADFLRKHPKKDKKRLHIKEEKVYSTPEDKYMICRTFREGCVWNKIYRKSLLDKINLKFVPGMYYEDRDFTARSLFYSDKLVTVPNTYYNYFVNPVSIVQTTMNEKKIEHYHLVRKQTVEFIIKNNIDVPDGLYKYERDRFYLFGKLLYSIKESTKSDVIYLFGKIKLFKIRKRKNDTKDNSLCLGWK